MRKLVVLLALTLALATLSGLPAASGAAHGEEFTATLNGSQQVPPLDTAGTGFASFRANAEGTMIDYRLYVNGLDDVTQAHIHLGAAGENGGVAAFLFPFDADGVAADGLLSEGTLTADDLIASQGFDGSMSQLLDRLRAGTAYVNVHTVANPPGELRGQILDPADSLGARLTGDAQVPPLDSAGSGYAAFRVDAAAGEVDYRLYVHDLDDVTQAHIHLGAAGENGPVMAFVFDFVEAGEAADGLLSQGTLTAADLIAVEGFDGSIEELIDHLRAGTAYVNVHTVANPSGELRGQTGPAAVNFAAELDGGSQVPPLDSPGTGLATFATNEGESRLDYQLIVRDLADVTQAHIHLGAPGENGPVAAFLFGFEADGVAADGILSSGSLTGDDVIANNGFGGSLSQLLDRLRAGTAYVNVHTMTYPPGEIRGQIAPLATSRRDGGRFLDDAGNVHEANIEAIAAAGITRGCNPPANDEYCGDDPLTRGQMAAFLSRALNLPAADSDTFTDDDGSIFEAEIEAIAAAGITVGCGEGLYCPDDPVTREQMASFLVRALGLTAGAGDDRFTDDDGSVHEGDIDRLAEAGITLGCNPPTNDEFCPEDTVRRDQMASFLARALGWTEAS